VHDSIELKKICRLDLEEERTFERITQYFSIFPEEEKFNIS